MTCKILPLMGQMDVVAMCKYSPVFDDFSDIARDDIASIECRNVIIHWIRPIMRPKKGIRLWSDSDEIGVDHVYILKWNKKNDRFTLKSILLDFVTVEFSLASLFLLFGRDARFTSLALVLDLSLWRYFLLFALLLCLIQLLRWKFSDDPIFTVLPGLAASLYLILTLLQEPPASYCIGIVIGISIAIFLCLPVYKSIWLNPAKHTRILIIVQITILMMTFFMAIYTIRKNLSILNNSPDYADLFKRMTELILLLMSAVVSFVIGNRFMKHLKILHNKSNIVIVILALVNFCLLGCLLVARVVALKTPTYDFGLFAQMFHYMNSTGQALTTLERNGLLSHFTIHLSPIYYLLLPFYVICPKPETLQILQVLVVLSGLIPLLLLCRHFLLTKSYQVILSFLYLFHPGIVGSSLYDLHENCFLAPLILWLLFFIEKDRRVLLFIAALFIFAVKEDAAMYVVLIGLFMLVSGKRKRTGAFLTLTGTVYFLFALYYLGTIGGGAMFGRYDNLLANKSWGFAGIIITLLTDPGYFLNELFIPGKLKFILTVFPALGFLPFMQRQCSRLLLLIPLVVMNLMPAFPYQYELVYQYHYATTVLMLYMVMLFLADTDFAVVPEAIQKLVSMGFPSGSSSNSDPASTPSGMDDPAGSADAADRKHGASFLHLAIVAVKRKMGTARNMKKACVLIALYFAVISSVFFTTKLLIGGYYPVSYFVENRSAIRNIIAELDKIPQNASIQASGMLTTYLSDRDVLYDLEYNQREKSPHETDYIVIDRRISISETTKSYISRFLSEHYTVLVDNPGQLLILAKP